MASYRVRFEGPSTLALDVATELADAHGIDLVSSDQPSLLGNGTVALTVVVEAGDDDILDAVANIRKRLPEGSSLTMLAG